MSCLEATTEMPDRSNKISVVIPVYNEAGNIGKLIEETFTVLPADLTGEVLVVDDGSDDGTSAEVQGLLRTRPKLRYLRHDVRSGQSAALRSGVLAARFPIIATMDGDGQNLPVDILKLLEAIAPPGVEGTSLVGGIRVGRKTSWSRRLASRIANRIRAAVLGDGCPDTGCGIKVFKRDAFLMLPAFSTMHRYLPTLMQANGYVVDYVEVGDRARLMGQSKYTNLGRALVGLYDLIGVTWLRRRTRIPKVSEEPDPVVMPRETPSERSAA